MKLGLLGHKIHYSLSPEIFEQLSKHHSVELQYDIYDLAGQDFIEFLKRSNHLRGFNVTIPYKASILEFAKMHTAEVLKTGSCNTIKIESDGWEAYNTDVFGITQAFKQEKREARGKTVLLIGAGGAARSSILAMKELGASEVTVWNRSNPRLGDLLSDPSFHFADMKVKPAGREWFGIDENKKFDILIHAVPYTSEKQEVGGGVGEFESRLIHHVKREGLVFDLVYRPFTTPLRLLCKEQGVAYESGLWMLIWQAVKSFEIWSGKKTDTAFVEKIHRHLEAKLLQEERR